MDARTGCILDCNETLARELGYAKSELIGLPVESLYEGDPTLQAGDVRDAELVLVRSDGSTLDVSLNARALRDGHGRVILTRLAWRDISARKQADRDRRFLLEFSDLLRNAAGPREGTALVAERLAHHLRAARCMFVDVDERRSRFLVRHDHRDGGKAIEGSYSHDLFDGLALQELRRGHTYVNGDTSRDPYTARYYEAFRAADVHAIITVPLRLEGELVAILAVTDRAPRVWQDREIALVQVVGERTWTWLEQQRAAQALRESEALKAAILDSSFDGIVSIDHRGAVLEFNPAAERLFGFERHEVLGRPMAELLVPAFLREAHARGLAHYLVTGEGPVIGRTVALPALRADGSEFAAEIAITRVAGQGRPTFTASIRDVSGRTRAEQEREDLFARLQVLDVQIEERVAARMAELAARAAELEQESR